MKNKEIRDAYLFVSPLIIFSSLFILLPVIGTLIISFFRDISFLSTKFIGFENFSRLLGDPHFWQSVRFTLTFLIVSVSLELVLGIFFALILNEQLRIRGFLRVAILIPWAIPVAVSARVWQLIYNYDYGILNYLLPFQVNWLGSSLGAFFSIVVSDIWKTTPFVTLIILAGLSTISKEVYEQARVDGADLLQRFFNITIPLLKPVIVVVLLFRTIDAVRIFDLIYVITGGGPGGSTTSLSLYAYKYFLSGNFGFGSAASVAIFLIAFTISVFYVRLGKFAENIK